MLNQIGTHVAQRGGRMLMNWDDLRIFDTVMREKKLSSAARNLGVSQTTVTRRLLALEAELGTKLVDKTVMGYRTTPAGEILLSLTENMMGAAAAIERWRAGLTTAPSGLVRIAAAGWTSRFLAAHSLELVSELPDVEIEIVTSYEFANLAQREVDIALRNKRPTEGRVAVRRLIDPVYAIYGHRSYVESNPAAFTDNRFQECDWIGYIETLSDLPSARWLAAHGARPPRVRCSSGMHVLDAIRAAIGLGVLPCFIGEPEPELVRVGPPIDRGDSSLWMVIHEDLRRVPRVRAVADRLVSLFETHARIFTEVD